MRTSLVVQLGAVALATASVGGSLCTDAKVFANENAFATVNKDMTVTAWGIGIFGGETSIASLYKPVETILASTKRSFLAVSADRHSVFVWGNVVFLGGALPEQDFKAGVVKAVGSETAYAILLDDGKVWSFGDSSVGGNSWSVRDQLFDVRDIFSTESAFAALKNDGSVVVWGSESSGGKLPDGFGNENVIEVFSTLKAFMAKKGDGSVECWGDPLYGGTCTDLNVQEGIDVVLSTDMAFFITFLNKEMTQWPLPSGEELLALPPGKTVMQIASTSETFALLLSDGSVKVWGNETTAPTSLEPCLALYSSKRAFACVTANNAVSVWGEWKSPSTFVISDTNFVQVVSNFHAFAAITASGKVIAWGDPMYGGDASSLPNDTPMRKLLATGFAFLAVSDDGSIFTWGHVDYGGAYQGISTIAPIKNVITGESISAVLMENNKAILFDSDNSVELDNVESITADRFVQVIAVVMTDNTVRTWQSGEPMVSDNGEVFLKTSVDNVKLVVPNSNAFAAILLDGSLSSWGSTATGGGHRISSKVKRIVASGMAFAAHLVDGSVSCFGHADFGGDCVSLSPRLANVRYLYSNTKSFLAVSGNDGAEVVAWPQNKNGGNVTGVNFQPGVKDVVSSRSAYAALKSDGTIVAWGNEDEGGTMPQEMSRVNQLLSNELGFAAVDVDGKAMAWGHKSSGVLKPLTIEAGVTSVIPGTESFSFTLSNRSAVVWPWFKSELTLPGEIRSIASGKLSVATLTADNAAAFWDASGVVFMLKPKPHLRRKRVLGGDFLYYIEMEDGTWETFGSTTIIKPHSDIACHRSTQVVPSPTSSPATPTAGPSTRFSEVGGLCREALVFSTNRAFATLNSNGSLTTWGYFQHETHMSNSPIESIGRVYTSKNGFLAVSTDGLSAFLWGDLALSTRLQHKIVFPQRKSVVDVIGNAHAFAMILSDGTVYCVGDPRFGGDISSKEDLLQGVLNISSTEHAFAALKEDGSIVAWGSPDFGGQLPDGKVSNEVVIAIYSTDCAFAALTFNSSLVCWGCVEHGGSCSVSEFQSGVKSVIATRESFTAILSGGLALTWPEPKARFPPKQISKEVLENLVVTRDSIVAMQSDGSLVSWGDSATVTSLPKDVRQCTILKSSMTSVVCVQSDNKIYSWGAIVANGLDGDSQILDVVGNDGAFAALTENGNVIAWGAPSSGGDLSSVRFDHPVRKIAATSSAFLAVEEDDSVTTWGDFTSGAGKPIPVKADLLGFCSSISSATILQSDGTAIIFGSKDRNQVNNIARIGCSKYSSLVAAVLQDNRVEVWGGTNTDAQAPVAIADVKVVVPNQGAYAAIKLDGSVISWGSSQHGGIYPQGIALSSKAVNIFATEGAFAVLLEDGSVHCFGKVDFGGDCSWISLTWNNVSSVHASRYGFLAVLHDQRAISWPQAEIIYLTPGVASVVNSDGAFAVLKTDGTVQAFGSEAFGGKSPSSLENIKQLISNRGAFAALNKEGSVIVWGDASTGGDKGGLDLSEGVSELVAGRESFVAIKSEGTAVLWPGKVAFDNVEKIAIGLDGILALTKNNSLVYSGSMGSMTVDMDPTKTRKSLYSVLENGFIIEMYDGSWETFGRLASLPRRPPAITCKAQVGSGSGDGTTDGGGGGENQEILGDGSSATKVAGIVIGILFGGFALIAGFVLYRRQNGPIGSVLKDIAMAGKQDSSV